MLQLFADAKKTMKAINNANILRSFLLLVFMSTISFLSETLVDVLDKGNMGTKILLGQTYLSYGAILLLAAEAGFKVKIKLG